VASPSTRPIPSRLKQIDNGRSSLFDWRAVMTGKKLDGAGLREQKAGETALCTVKTNSTDLRYRGYDIRTLIEKATFEEVAYLLLKGQLPNQKKLADYINNNQQIKKLTSRA
jgi:2-methylcitrate synthase